MGNAATGYDAGKRVKGRKRHILVDTLGNLFNLLQVVVHPAAIQDRKTALALNCCSEHYLKSFTSTNVSNASGPMAAIAAS